MVAEEPEVAGLGHRLVGRLGHIVGVGQSVLRLGGCQGREYRCQSLGAHRDLGEELAQLGLVGRGHRREPIERRQDEPLLVGGEVDVEDGDRWLAAADGEGDTQVAIDDVAGALVDEDVLDPADLIEHPGECVLLGLRMDAEVRRVGEQLVRGFGAGPDDA